MKIDSPLIKCLSNNRPRLPTQESDWETVSEESDGNCGYVSDYESDEDLYMRNNSPERLRESVVRSRFDKLESPVPPLLSLKRKRSSSIRNIEHLLDEDSVELLEGDTESAHFLAETYSESVHVLASTLIEGRKSDARHLEFVPDISSVVNPDRVNFHNILSPGSSPGAKSPGSGEVIEGPELPRVGIKTKHRQKAKSRRGKLSLSNRKKKGATSMTKERPPVEKGQVEEAISEKESQRGENSDEILLGTPQNHNILTLSRKKKSAEKLKKTVESKDQSKFDKMEKKTRENDGSDDDLIIIDSSPFESSSSKKKSKRKILKNIAVAAADDCVKLCEFPVGKSDTVTVAIQDYATLEHDTFLNDIIIDFYLTYLVHNILPLEDRSTVHLFSTMFYKRLMQAPKKNAKKVAPYETDSTLSSAEKRHFRVAGWTKSVDLFEKDVLIVPICEHSHWYLLLVVKPGLITSPIRSEERAMLGEPFIIVLDSMGGTKDSAVRNIRQYLSCEWTKKKCTGDSATEEYSFSGAEMRTVRPMKPEQENYSDCGIFLLHYVEKVFNSVAQFFWPALPDLSDWFTIEEVGRKRGEIADLIKCLASEQNPGKVIDYPKINFTAARKPRKRQKPIVYTSDEDEEEAEVRSQGKFASAIHSSRDRDAKSKMAKTKRHESRRQDKEQGIKTVATTSTTSMDCEISNVVCVSPKVRNKPKNNTEVKEEFCLEPVNYEGKSGKVASQKDDVSSKSSDALQLKEKKRKGNSFIESSVSVNENGSSSNSRNSSNCDKTRVPEPKTNSHPDSQIEKERKLRKLRADQIRADLEEFEKHSIEEEEAIKTMNKRMDKNGSFRDSSRDKIAKVSSAETTPNPKVHVIPPDGSDTNLSKILSKTLEQLSPNVKSSHDRGRLSSESPLYSSPSLMSSKSIKDNHHKVVSRSSLESTGEPSTSETSGELFTPGLRGGSHIVAHNSREEIKAKSRVKDNTNKKFKLAAKNVKLSRYEETPSQKVFNNFMFASSSEGDSDIFSQENE